MLLDGLTQTLGQGLPRLVIAIGQQGDELLAAIAGQQVAAAQLGLRELRHMLQHKVAGFVAMLVVDALGAGRAALCQSAHMVRTNIRETRPSSRVAQRKRCHAFRNENPPFALGP